VVASIVLAALPWIFGFADESANVWFRRRTRRGLPRPDNDAGGYGYRKGNTTTVAAR
jgi:hypothetical protein